VGFKFNPITGSLDWSGSSSGGTASNSFATIQADSGTSPAASSATDTLTITCVDQTMTVVGDSTTDKITLSARSNPGKYVEFFEEFAGGAATHAYSWVADVSTGGTSNRSTGSGVDSTTLGIHTLGLGTTGLGLAGLRMNVSILAVGGGAYRARFDVNITDISTGAQEYVYRNGFLYTANAIPTNGIWFEYDRANYGANWQAVVCNAGSYTRTDTGVAVVTAQRIKLGFDVNAAGTSVIFKIAGTTVATMLTASGHNIPISTRVMMPAFHALKTVGTSASSILFHHDYWYLDHTFTTDRSFA
jgi:hypothetical protein